VGEWKDLKVVYEWLHAWVDGEKVGGQFRYNWAYGGLLCAPRNAI